MKNKSLQGMVREFATTMGQQVDQDYELLDNSGLEAMRWELIESEYNELRDAIQGDLFTGVDKAHILKEIADLVYVLYGYADTWGWDLDTAMVRVHKSNMSKVGPDGVPKYREDGKVLKHEGYKPPSLGDLV